MNVRTKTKKKTRGNYFSVTELKERGWTDTMINKLLKRLRPKLIENPYYACAAPMKLYLKKSVLKKEDTEEFKILLEKSKVRKAISQNTVKTKIKKTLEKMESFSLEVERIPLDELKKLTLEHKQAWYNFIAQQRGYYESDYAWGADEETIERWELNFVRHRLTNYDYELSKLKNKVGKDIAYQKYHNILLDKIEEVYPELKDAIGRHGKYIIEDESE